LLLGLLPFQLTTPLAAIIGLWRMAERKGWRGTAEWDVPNLPFQLAYRTHAVLFVLCIICSFIINWLSKTVCDKLGIPFPEQSLIQMAHGNSNVLFWSIAFFSVMILAPCVEEFIYRQIMFKALEGALHSRWAAVVLTSLCFAAAHGVWPMAPALFALGLLFQEAKRRGGLRQSILLHSCYNGTMLALVLMFD
jgi:membrane protease YdiL (CAAX protease family)